MSTVPFDKVSLRDYAEIIGREEIEKILSFAKKLEGRSVVHVNSTAFGGGVAEILRRLVPLMNDVGLEATWKVIKGEREFFNVTKAFHNALQGEKIDLTEEVKETYLKYNELNADLLDLDYDYVVIHDPQPLAILNYREEKTGTWIWRSFICVQV